MSKNSKSWEASETREVGQGSQCVYLVVPRPDFCAPEALKIHIRSERSRKRNAWCVGGGGKRLWSLGVV